LDLSISEVLGSLAKQRPIFHSEADLQHALAWAIHGRLPGASVRLKRPVSVSKVTKPLHLDVWVEQDGDVLAIELKYKTRALQMLVGNEQYALRSQSAQDIGRYDFIKDIERVENIVADRAPCAAGYAILLTNDPTYWTQSLKDDTVDVKFRLHEGSNLHSSLEWGPEASEGTKRGREKPLLLSGSYALQWEDYSQVADGTYDQFRYLLVEVKSEATIPVPVPSDPGIH
jgi:hypothetical protein